MTAKPAHDIDQIDILFAMRLLLDAAAPETSVHQLFTRAIAEIERLRRENADLRAQKDQPAP